MGKKTHSLYLECASGISGDMSVAALLDLGADEKLLLETLASIPIPSEEFSIGISTVFKSGIRCMDFDVILDEEHENHDHDMEYLHGHEHEEQGHVRDEHARHEHEHAHHHEHRNLKDVYSIIDATKMTEEAGSLAKKIFLILAEAEAKAHGRHIEDVHFHEVGAIDSIVDIIALATCFTNLNISKVYVPSISEGKGFVRCAHGMLPVPVPAVTNIAEKYGLNLSFMEEEGEFVTPTGAAFIAAVKTDDTLPKKFRITNTGLGAGKRTYRRASILRAMFIEEAVSEKENQTDTIVKLETNMDDCTGEAMGFVMEELFSHGAKDVSFSPCFMKKNRPGYTLTVICEKEDISLLEKIIFENTTTIGIRRIEMERTILPRENTSVSTKYGQIEGKKVFIDGKERVYPEHDSLAKSSRVNNISYEEARRSFLKS